MVIGCRVWLYTWQAGRNYIVGQKNIPIFVYEGFEYNLNTSTWNIYQPGLCYYLRDLILSYTVYNNLNKYIYNHHFTAMTSK